jgi:quinol monooxygenase YgiN
MDVVFVHVHVKPDMVAEFIAATRENANHSSREPHCVLQFSSSRTTRRGSS